MNGPTGTPTGRRAFTRALTHPAAPPPPPPTVVVHSHAPGSWMHPRQPTHTRAIILDSRPLVNSVSATPPLVYSVSPLPTNMPLVYSVRSQHTLPWIAAYPWVSSTATPWSTRPFGYQRDPTCPGYHRLDSMAIIYILLAAWRAASMAIIAAAFWRAPEFTRGACGDHSIGISANA